MPGIYERDNINYGGMLGNAMAAKANYLKNRYDRVADMGRTWGSAVSNSGQAIQNVLNQYAQQQYQAEQNALNREDALKRAREQQAWQTKENKLNRDNTYNIALMNKASQDAAKTDEWTKEYNKSTAKLTELDAMLRKNPNDEILKYQRAMAMADQEFYGKKLGIRPVKAVLSELQIQESNSQEPAPQETPPAPTGSTYNNKELTNNIDTLLTGAWTNAKKEKANGFLNQIQDQALRDIYAQKIANKLDTVEEAKAKADAELKKYDEAFQKMSQMEQDTWLDDHPDFTRQNGHLARKNK